MNNKYDYIVIGSGISGCYVANKLTTDFPNSKVLIITRDNKIGGVWQQTKWSWLCSDTPALYYTTNENLQYIYSKYKATSDGVQRKHIIKLLNEQTLNLEIKFNTEVYSLNFSSEKNTWDVKTSNDNFICTLLFNCTGLFQTPYIPNEYSEYLIKNNIKFCHSSRFNDREINKDAKCAVIGSRESGFQIVKGLSKTNKIDWYARSFNHLYVDLNYTPISGIYKLLPMYNFLISNNIDVTKLLTLQTHLTGDVFYYILKLKGIINNNVLSLYVNKFMCNKEFLMKLKIKDCEYNIEGPIKPIVMNSKGLNYENIQAIQIANNNLSFLHQYDLVILATGYCTKEPFEIFVDDKKINVDLFSLVDSVRHYKIPNMFFSLPYSDVSYSVLQILYKRIKILLENKMISVTKREHNNSKKKIMNFLKDLGMTKEEYLFTFKTQTLLHYNLHS